MHCSLSVFRGMLLISSCQHSPECGDSSSLILLVLLISLKVEM